MLTDICKASTQARLKSNGGTIVTHQAGNSWWIQATCVVSSTSTGFRILSLANLRMQYRVTYDSDHRCFVVHRENGCSDMHFVEHASGLHIYEPMGGMTFVTTVAGNKELFSNQQIEAADRACILQTKLGLPSLRDFRWMVQGNHFWNCSIHPNNIEIATKIWGPNVAILKCKTTCSTPLPVVADFIKVPQAILDLHRDVTILADIFFVNQIPFSSLKATTYVLPQLLTFPTGKLRRFSRRIRGYTWCTVTEDSMLSFEWKPFSE